MELFRLDALEERAAPTLNAFWTRGCGEGGCFQGRGGGELGASSSIFQVGEAPSAFSEKRRDFQEGGADGDGGER